MAEQVGDVTMEGGSRALLDARRNDLYALERNSLRFREAMRVLVKG